MSGTFYIIPTPIGNITDITLRAIDVLKNVDYIACEDTRVTKVLADKYGLNAKLFACHKFNEKESSIRIVSLLKKGKNLALVSDAGTPGISDPGSVLLAQILKEDIKVSSLPGACAVTTFLSRVPRDNEEYSFIGFIPRQKNAQKQILDKYKYTNCVFYEAPDRLIRTLSNIAEFYGVNAKIAIGRELTKMFEEVKIASVKEIIDYYSTNTLKGEIVAMVFAKDISHIDNDELTEKINILKDEGFSPKDITKIITKLYNVSKNEVYKLTIKD